MNKSLYRIVFSLIAMLLLGTQAYAQFTTTFAKNASAGQQNGLYYSLPQTMLQLDFVVVETTYEEGLLSDYAGDYFETSVYDWKEGTTYALADVTMTTKSTPDPYATFFVSFNVIRGFGKPMIDILPNGIIRSVGVYNQKEYIHELPAVEKTEDIVAASVQAPMETQNISLMTTGKTNAQLAKEVADKIEEIRKSKFYLISGDVETATNPETFNAMYSKLDELEQQYMSLFIGTRVSRQTVHTVYVVPDKEMTTQIVARFSESEGLTLDPEGKGTAISVETVPLNTLSNINVPSQSAIESMSYENKIMYRIPETTNVKVSLGDQTILQKRQLVNQFGVLVMAPLQGSRLVFDTETGQIVNMKYL